MALRWWRWLAGPAWRHPGNARRMNAAMTTRTMMAKPDSLGCELDTPRATKFCALTERVPSSPKGCRCPLDELALGGPAGELVPVGQLQFAEHR